jgi:hypothetical protein
MKKTKKTKKTLAKRTRKRPAPDVEPRFAPVVAAFSGDRRVSQKRMFSSSNVLTVNGKIFASKTDWVELAQEARRFVGQSG